MKPATLKYGTALGVSVLFAALASPPAHADRLVIPLTDTDSLTHIEEFNWFGGEDDFSAGISFADFDGDGDLDIVSVNGRHWPVADMLLLNDGKGRFPMAAEIGDWRTTGYGGCPADIDDDGDMDLLVPRDWLPVAVFRNGGAGNLTATGEIGEAGAARGCATADLNRDGAADLIIADRKGGSFIAFGPLGPDARTLPLPGLPAVGITSGDLNSDDEADIVLALRGGATLAVLLGEGDGFAAPVLVGDAAWESRSVALADWDCDGDLDLVTAILSGANRVFLNEGGKFTKAVLIGPEEEVSQGVRVADLNSDGRPDAIFANEGQNAVVINTDGLPQRTLLPGNEDTYDLAVGDLNGDSLPDIGFANSDASNTLFFLIRSGDAE
tara:strand:+ start:1599 stop:2747 length:1149 start_codon:yes stop_codon:yes gene_type:complete